MFRTNKTHLDSIKSTELASAAIHVNNHDDDNKSTRSFDTRPDIIINNNVRPRPSGYR